MANARINKTLNETRDLYEAYKRANEQLAAERDEAPETAAYKVPRSEDW